MSRFSSLSCTNNRTDLTRTDRIEENLEGEVAVEYAVVACKLAATALVFSISVTHGSYLTLCKPSTSSINL